MIIILKLRRYKVSSYRINMKTDSDEAFIVLKGEMFIESPEQTIKIQEGEMCVVDKNTIHKPFALSECWIMLVELAGTVNTGDANSANLESTAGSKI